MNWITYQLAPFAPVLSENPIPKRDFVRKVHQFAQRKGVKNLLNMLEFTEARLQNGEIVLQ